MLGKLLPRREEARDVGASLSWADYQRLGEMFGYNGVQYVAAAGGLQNITAQQAGRNPIILGCMVIRGMTFSQVEFKFRDLKTGALQGNPTLQILESPWPGAATADLLSRMEFDASRFGNSYWWIRRNGAGRQLVWLDPLRVDIVTADIRNQDGEVVGKELLGYTLKEHGQIVATFDAGEVVHYRPIPDPDHPFRGLSWLSALLPDVVADQDLTDFKHSFVQNAATPNMVVTFDPAVRMGPDALKNFRDRLESRHTGPQNGFRTLYLAPGADAKVVGANLEQLQLTATQANGEVRFCVAAGVPAPILGIAEGLKGATLNSGNYTATRRRFTDMTIRPLWTTVSKALEAACPPPPGFKLWYDTTNVAFLQEDAKDSAVIRQADASTMLTLVNAGFEPETVVSAVSLNTWSGLKHTGALSVQLQPIGSVPALDTADPSADDTSPDDSGDDGGLS